MFAKEVTGEEARARIADGTTWAEFCDTLKSAGVLLDRPASPKDLRDRAEGYRYLSRLLRAGLEAFVEHGDPLAPVLRRMVHETVKMGADNPDNYYLNAAISGAHRYRIVGKRNSVAYLGFGIQSGNYGVGGGQMKTGAYLEASDMHIEPDGSFTIELSVEPAEGNWLPMTPDSTMLIVRQTFLDRETERVADLQVERLDGDGRPTPLTPEAIDRGLTQAARFVGGASAIFAMWAEGFQKVPNTLPRFNQAVSNAFGGDPNIAYYHGYWQLGPGEALVVEATPPECMHWNFQINNHWMESLDYRYFPVVINKHRAKYRPDGSVRIVVAHEDPGVDNWLSTVGHDRGTMCFRWTRAKEHPEPNARVVPVAELGASRR